MRGGARPLTINSVDHFSAGGLSGKRLYRFFSADPSGAWRRADVSLPKLFSFDLSHVALLLKVWRPHLRHRSLATWRATECDSKSFVAVTAPLVGAATKAVRLATKNRPGRGFFVVSMCALFKTSLLFRAFMTGRLRTHR